MLPKAGQVAEVRQRRYLVTAVDPDGSADGATLVHLSCLDDDAPGEALSVLWELEVGARIQADKSNLLQDVQRLDAPRTFGAYLNAVRWECVTSTDKRLLQAPFRAGIDLKPYQLEPLRKALELPRVNLFIADDVGLGKTIEAGLVLQELVLRQRIDQVLVVCPPALVLQWKEELAQRFGLLFDVFDEDFVSQRRRERGWAVNPWTTSSRFVVSLARLRGQRERKGGRGRGREVLEQLLNALPVRPSRSLLILDEAHQVAPSTGSAYAIDSLTTSTIRKLAARFEHRLFLSATPHNGHSNSFSALLEILDPQRFTRGVPVTSVRQLEPVMVRRLKRDLREHVGGLPDRKLQDHIVRFAPDSPERQLGTLLALYEEKYREHLSHLPEREQEARALVCVTLHKRLLSSIVAFARTLDVHRASAAKLLATPSHTQGALPLAPSRSVDSDVGDEELDAREEAWIAASTVSVSETASTFLGDMVRIARNAKELPDGRARILAEWIAANLCPNGVWNGRRVIVFTEYDDTLSWLRRTLPILLGRVETDGRIEVYRGSGGASDLSRERLKVAFNTHPEAHPLRVLLATDAAREGLNLQAYCYDLFHFDLPWNPGRIEQRNGRIDRTLQPAPEVFCHYFDLPDLPENKVLRYMVRKLGTIAKELGSVPSLLTDRLASRTEKGIRSLDVPEIDDLCRPTDGMMRAAQQLESKDAATLRADLATLDRQCASSARAMGYRIDHLREAVDEGLRLVTGSGLIPVPAAPRHDGDTSPPPPSWRVPKLDASWNPVLEVLQATDPRTGRTVVRPVTFEAAHRLDSDTVQLHLGHPLVKRLIARFRAQGFASNDLSLITAIACPGERVRRLVALGRLVLYGDRAVRLHEEVVCVAAEWRDQHHPPTPYGETTAKATLELLWTQLAAGPRLPEHDEQTQILSSAARHFAQLWPALEAQGRRAGNTAKTALEARATEEANAMGLLIEQQVTAIRKTLAKELNYTLQPSGQSEKDQRDRDERHMRVRLGNLDTEREREPERVRAGYRVVLTQFQPLGLVALWPEAAGAQVAA